MFRYLFLVGLSVFLFSACATSDSGAAQEPIVSPPLSASDAGQAAISNKTVDPRTCEGVLGRPPVGHMLGTQSLTNTAQDDAQQVSSMCSAVYETSNPGDPFLTVALIKFNSDDPAIAHYDLLKDAFVVLSHPISEINNADEDLTDRFSALMDTDGIGRTTVMRQNNWVLTVSIGPTTADSLWTADDLQLIGESIIRRTKA